MIGWRLRKMGKLMYLSEKELKEAIQVHTNVVRCICETEQVIFIEAVELKPVGDGDLGIIGKIGKCLVCGRVYFRF